MGENKKYRTKALQEKLADKILITYSKEQIEEYNFANLIRYGVICEEKDKVGV